MYGGNLNRRPIGKCSRCGGVVSIPIVFHSVKRPVPTCENCGAVANEAANLPVIETTPSKPMRTWKGKIVN